MSEPANTSGGATPPARLTVLLLALVCALLLGFTINAVRVVSSHKEPIKESDLKRGAEESVFRVMVRSEMGISGGTAYALKTKEQGVLVITNKHICDIPNEDGIFILDQEARQWPTTIRRKGKLTDLCILEPPQSFVSEYKGLTLANPLRDMQMGDMLFVYGHPGLRKLTASSGPFINEAVIPTFGDYLEAKTLLVGRADIAIFPGSSGSPVLNDEGEVVGTIFAYEGPEMMALFIPLSAMKTFLRGDM